MPVAESLALVGSIAANEAVEIKSETEGIVQDIPFAEGQRVGKGQLLLQLDDSKFAAALAEAEASFRLSQANFDRSKQLAIDRLISSQEHDQAAATFEMNRATLELKRRLLRDTRIQAPFAGIAGARSVSPGQVITRSTTLTTLVDLDIVKVEVNVPERYLQQVKAGQPLEFGVAAYPGRKFKGDVYFIAAKLDEGTRTALVKARIPNEDGTLRAGMFASLELNLQLRESAIVVPEPAVLSDGDRFNLFVVGTNLTAELRTVTVGLRLAGKAEILTGIRPDERVVVEGNQKLRPGAPVRLAPKEASEPYLN
jgi:membrane fusion protein (multidrug efflux system)